MSSVPFLLHFLFTDILHFMGATEVASRHISFSFLVLGI